MKMYKPVDLVLLHFTLKGMLENDGKFHHQTNKVVNSDYFD